MSLSGRSSKGTPTRDCLTISRLDLSEFPDTPPPEPVLGEEEVDGEWESEDAKYFIGVKIEGSRCCLSGSVCNSFRRGSGKYKND